MRAVGVEPIQLFQNATTVDPKFALAYSDWAVEIADQGNIGEAVPLFAEAS